MGMSISVGVGICAANRPGSSAQVPPEIAGAVITPTPVRVNQLQTAIVSWTGNPGSGTLTYQWMADGVDIGGATASTYTPLIGNLAKSLSVRGTVDNGVGSPMPFLSPEYEIYSESAVIYNLVSGGNQLTADGRPLIVVV